jgi:hypothetical protein
MDYLQDCVTSGCRIVPWGNIEPLLVNISNISCRRMQADCIPEDIYLLSQEGWWPT